MTASPAGYFHPRVGLRALDHDPKERVHPLLHVLLLLEEQPAQRPPPLRILRGRLDRTAGPGPSWIRHPRTDLHHQRRGGPLLLRRRRRRATWRLPWRPSRRQRRQLISAPRQSCCCRRCPGLRRRCAPDLRRRRRRRRRARDGLAPCDALGVFAPGVPSPELLVQALLVLQALALLGTTSPSYGNPSPLRLNARIWRHLREAMAHDAPFHASSAGPGAGGAENRKPGIGAGGCSAVPCCSRTTRAHPMCQRSECSSHRGKPLAPAAVGGLACGPGHARCCAGPASRSPAGRRARPAGGAGSRGRAPPPRGRMRAAATSWRFAAGWCPGRTCRGARPTTATPSAPLVSAWTAAPGGRPPPWGAIMLPTPGGGAFPSSGDSRHCDACSWVLAASQRFR